MLKKKTAKKPEAAPVIPIKKPEAAPEVSQPEKRSAILFREADDMQPKNPRAAKVLRAQARAMEMEE